MSGKMRKKRVGLLAGGLCLGMILSNVGRSSVQAATPQFFDWSVPAESGGPNYTPAPFLDDTNFASVDSFLAARAANPANLLAVKVISPLKSAGAKAIFNKYKINYVFADFEDGSALTNTQTLATTVKASSKSASAFIGDFSMAPLSSDPTRPSGLPGTTPVASGKHSLFTPTQYQQAKVNMANPALYPGAPDFRNLADGNAPTAPNIRSSLLFFRSSGFRSRSRLFPRGRS